MTRIILAGALALLPTTVSAATPIDLGRAASFAVLSGAAVTSAGTTAITGDVGVAPGVAIVGSPTVTGGTLHSSDALAVGAEADLAVAYDAAAGEPGAVILSGQDLGGMVLGPGVYRFGTSAQLTGTLALDGRGDPQAVFLFQIGTTLISAADAAVTVVGGAQAANVFFQVGTAATLGTGTQFAGTIMADTSITLTSGAGILAGRALARSGAVTLVSSTVALPVATAVPEPADWALFVVGFGLVGGLRRIGRRAPRPAAR